MTLKILKFEDTVIFLFILNLCNRE